MTSRFISFLLCLFLLLLLGCKKDFTVYKAEQGILDLRNWNPELESVISLDGVWEFYWNGLYKESELENIKADYINLPSTWNNKIVAGKKLDGSGFATFKLKILLPDRKDFPTLAIRIKPLTNCKVFVNQVELNCIGTTEIGRAHV